jgi:8-oxo-dGTP diphosphatase
MTTSDRRAYSVAVFAVFKGRVLFVKHRLLGMWLPVGGEVESGETPLEAATRELKEETGLVATWPVLPDHVDGTPGGFIGFEEHEAGPKGLHMNFNFVAVVDTDQVALEERALSEFKWLEPKQVIEAYDDDVPFNVKQLAGRVWRLIAGGDLDQTV